MFNTWQALFRLRPVGEELRAELNRMLIQRLRIGVLLALVFIPSFVPLDYLRMPDHFAWAVTVRGTGCVLLLGLVVLLSIDAAERWAEGLAAIGVGVISGTVLGVARFAHGADDPVYLVQAMAIISLVTGTALLLPLRGRSILFLGAIPLALQILLSIHYDWQANLPILVSTLTAIVVATVGAQTGFLARLREYESRRVLRRSEQKYRSLFEEYRDGLLLSAPDGRLVDANPAAVALFGYDRKEEFLTLSTHALYYGSAELERARLGRLFVVSGFSLRDVDVEVKHKEGRKLNVVVTSTPIRNERGEIAGFSTILRDVTERKVL